MAPGGARSAVPVADDTRRLGRVPMSGVGRAGARPRHPLLASRKNCETVPN